MINVQLFIVSYELIIYTRSKFRTKLLKNPDEISRKL